MPEGHPAHFTTNERASFPYPLTEADADWWNAAIKERVRVFPDELPKFLASGIEGTPFGTYSRFDSVAKVFELGVSLTGPDSVQIAFKNKRFEVAGGLINSGVPRVHPDWQERGIGTRMMINLIDFAEGIGARRIDIEAQDIGRYAWLPMGFLPDKTSWKEKVAPLARRYVTRALIAHVISRDDHDDVMNIAGNDDPRFARELVAVRTPVPGIDRTGQWGMVPLCRAIMLQQGTDWNGSFELDEDTLAFFKVYKERHDAKFPAAR